MEDRKILIVHALNQRVPESITRYILEEFMYKKIVDNHEFKKAINLWFDDNKRCILLYGHISNWNTINVTDMSHTFDHKRHFNENISRWNKATKNSIRPNW